MQERQEETKEHKDQDAVQKLATAGPFPPVTAVSRRRPLLQPRMPSGRWVESEVQLRDARRRPTSALRTEVDKVKGWEKVFHANRIFFKKQRYL